MSLDFISQYYISIVLAACLAVGYVIKKSLDFIPNKYIPLILAVLGAVLGCITEGTVSMESIVYGAITGLASTGLHQTFTRMMEGVDNGASEENKKEDGGGQNGKL
ncbi:phage holin family protein [Anaerostipes hominis (ex Lee et al. 2021)]|uniref:phage holin family protein n=1 Tax=Anaerostipes hominis (ex Lee et al. 2021) TaxID=2025494 RepID=UPI0022E7D345|nr:phage holin family protein [Anaerostipes hominis (ex Lee et al. 2021)]